VTVVKGDRMISPVPQKGFPGLVSIERAELHCGCACYIGKRLTDLELATVAIPCSEAHEEMMRVFRDRYAETEDDPALADRLAVDVADQVLMAVAAEML
jgi:hypothetical protein